MNPWFLQIEDNESDLYYTRNVSLEEGPKDTSYIEAKVKEFPIIILR